MIGHQGMGRVRSVKPPIAARASGERTGTSRATGSAHQGRKRKLYMVTKRSSGGVFGYELSNNQTLFSGGPCIFLPPPGNRGFRNYPEMPVFIAGGKRGQRTGRDFEQYSVYWFISDRMKAVLERVDPGAFAFLKCRVQLPNGMDGPTRWLCDVVRVLDALDEEKSSKIGIGTADNGRKVYLISWGVPLIFKDDVVGPHHIFRMMYFEPIVICDEEMRLACKTANLTGISFVEADKP